MPSRSAAIGKRRVIADIYANRDERHFILVRYIRNPDGLSVTNGRFDNFSWDRFKVEALVVVKRAIADYPNSTKTGPSQFDLMPREERISFFGRHVGLQVNQRDTDLWWIDLMRPVGDGSMAGPVGPPYRIQFSPSEGSSRFFDALLRLMLLNEAYNEN